MVLLSFILLALKTETCAGCSISKKRGPNSTCGLVFKCERGLSVPSKKKYCCIVFYIVIHRISVLIFFSARCFWSGVGLDLFLYVPQGLYVLQRRDYRSNRKINADRMSGSSYLCPGSITFVRMPSVDSWLFCDVRDIEIRAPFLETSRSFFPFLSSLHAVARYSAVYVQ